jgi:hypothetical protein
MDYSIPVVQPVSLAESMKQWQDVKRGQQEQKLNEMKLANAPEEQAMLRQQHQASLANSQQQLQTGQQTFDIKQHAQLKGLTTDIMAKLEQTAQAQGIPADPNNPQYQQLAHQIYMPYIPAIQQVTGKQIDPNQPVDVNAMAAISGSTPGQQQAQDIQGKVAEKQALMPVNIQAAQAKYRLEHQGELEKEQRVLAGQKELIDYKTNAENIDAGFTPGAIDNAAARYNADGTLPPMGMGKTGAAGRQSILNRAAEIAGVSGADQRTTQMQYKASAQALNQITKQQTMVSAFEKNFSKNADMALGLSDKVDRTGVPIVNKWLQAGQKSITGNPEVSQFHAANQTVINEYAKIMSGSMGNTAVSDSARNRAESLLSTAHTPEQYRAVMSTLKQETGNRMAGFDEEKRVLVDGMKNPKQEKQQSQQPETKTLKNGKTYIKQGNDWHEVN